MEEFFGRNKMPHPPQVRPTQSERIEFGPLLGPPRSETMSDVSENGIRCSSHGS